VTVSKYAPIHQAFAEQLAFFRKKLNLPTEVWDDIERMAHDRAFIVAGAQGADLLQDLRGAIDDSIENGTGLEAFRKNFKRIVAEHGWTGWTGEGTKAGEAWRTKVIYQTNMSTSYAAGRWKQLTDPALLKISPYWQYHHMDGLMYPRPLHESWDGLTLHYTHPFWLTHFPTNGWGCHCWVTAVTKEQYMLAIANGKGQAPAGWDAIDPKTGAPVGIDKGFDYAPGANADRPLLDFINQKLIKLDAPIGAAMWDSLKTVLMAEQAAAVREMVAIAAASMEPAGASVVASVVSPDTVSALSSRGIALNDAAIWLRDHELIHAIRDAKSAQLPLDVWLDLPKYLDKADVYLDTDNGTLLYAFDMPGVEGKVIVRINYANKVRVDGVRSTIISNFIVTGGVIDATQLGASRYVLL